MIGLLQSSLMLPLKFYRRLRRSRGRKRLVGILFLVLTIINILYFIFETKPVNAFIISDLTALGRTVGDAIHATALAQIKEVYTDKRYGILPYICRTCLFFALPVIGVGIVSYLGEDGIEDGPVIAKPVFMGSLIFYVLLSGGGAVYGLIYYWLISIFEGIINKFDDFINIYSAIAEGKTYLAANGIISAAIAECQRFTGQEQQRCIAETTQKALESMGQFKETFPGAKWLDDIQTQLRGVASNILSPEKNLVDKALNIWYAFNAPLMELRAAADAAASITAFTAIYGAIIVFLGLAGPLMGLSSLLVPGLQNGWIAFICIVFGVFYWRFSFLVVMFSLSDMMTKAGTSATISTAWFAEAVTKIAPYISLLVAGAGVGMTWTGITSAIGRGAYGGFVAGIAAPVTQPGMAPPPSPRPPAIGGGGARTDY
jgi:hypothetical protein